MTAIEWDGPDENGWSCAATAGGGCLIVTPRASGGWAPAWTAPSGHVLWTGGPLPALEAAQRAAEAEVRRWAGRLVQEGVQPRLDQRQGPSGRRRCPVNHDPDCGPRSRREPSRALRGPSRRAILSVFDLDAHGQCAGGPVPPRPQL